MASIGSSVAAPAAGATMRAQSLLPAVPGVQAAPAAAASPAAPATTPPVSAQANSNMGPADMYNLVLNQNDLSHLMSWGINTPDRMAFWAGGGIRRFFLSLFTGIPTQSLQRYAQEADLCKVPGMQSQWAIELNAAGVTGPMQLAQYGSGGMASSINQGMLFAQVASNAIQLSASTGRIFTPPSISDIAYLAYYSQGLTNSVT